MIKSRKFFIIIGAILLLQFSFWGMKYFPILDDNNQLGLYNVLNDNIQGNIIESYGSYNVRPFAFFSEVYIFQWLWNCKYVLLLIFSIMHILNIYLFYKIFEKINIKLGYFSMILMCFTPVLFEALYWISASDRIIFGLFLSLSSIYILLKSFDQEKKSLKILMILVAIILNIFCVGFYEQVVALNFFLFTVVLVVLKKYKYLFIPIISTMWIGIYYIISMSKGMMQARGALDSGSILQKIMSIIFYTNARIIDVLKVVKGAIKNINENIFASISSIFLVIMVGYLIYFLFKETEKNSIDKKENLKKIIIGLLIMLVSLLPFIAIQSPYIAMRNLFLPFWGVAIFLEGLLDLALSFINNSKVIFNIKLTLIVIVLIISLISNIDELAQYKRVSELDDKIAKQIIEVIPLEEIDSSKSILIKFDQGAMYKAKNVRANIICAFEVDWSATGKIQVMTKNEKFAKIYINDETVKPDYILEFDENMQLIK